jgi:hypothetical protein
MVCRIEEEAEDLFHPGPDLGQQPDHEGDEGHKQAQEQVGMVQCHPQPAHHHDVLDHGGGPVGERFGGGVDEDARPGFGRMGHGRHASAHQGRRQGQGRVHGPCRACRQHRPGRDADEGVQGVPACVHAGNLVGHELDYVHETRSQQHCRVGQDFKTRRKRHAPGHAHEAEHEHGRVKIDAAGPGRAHGQGDDGDNAR